MHLPAVPAAQPLAMSRLPARRKNIQLPPDMRGDIGDGGEHFVLAALQLDHLCV
jgi:hypothetical protein